MPKSKVGGGEDLSSFLREVCALWGEGVISVSVSLYFAPPDFISF
jgi:hypothetical protein